MIIGIDNGNYNTKSSTGELYTSGFTTTQTQPISLENVIEYEGEYYIIGDKRAPVQPDKTTTDDAFILSLPMIAMAMGTMTTTTIELGVGLPITLYGKQKETFANYFKRTATFKWQGVEKTVTVADCKAFPQGFAAYISQYKALGKYSTLYLIDIGGYTIDVLAVINGKADKSITASLPYGVIKLYHKIATELLSIGIQLSEQQLTAVIKGDDIDHMDRELIHQIVETQRLQYIKHALNQVQELGIDLRNPVALCGGGAELLAQYIAQEKINCVATLDRFANADGYKILMEGKK